MDKKIVTPLLFFILLTASMVHADSWNGWIYQNPYPTSNSLLAVKFVTPNKGWLAGEGGVILHTEDGGETWEYQESGTEKQIKSLFFVNELQGWAVGGQGDGPVREKGMILHTNDGGKTWVEQQGEFDSTLNSVFFLDGQEGWIAGKEGVLLHTTDGGKKWERQKNADVMHAIASVYFLNARTGWLLAGDEIYRTTDGGKKWAMSKVDITSQGPELPRGAVAIDMMGGTLSPAWSQGALYFANDKQGWVVVGLGFIFSTVDGGTTWTEKLKTGKLSYGLGNISFFDTKRGCATGTSIICTEDGGVTWKERLGIQPRGRERVDDFLISLVGLSLVNQSTGWTVGSDGQIMKTEDGGKTWKMAAKRDECGGNTFFIDKKTGWLHGNGRSLICRTDDGGHSWIKTNAGFSVSGIYFIDESNGWAVGWRKEGEDKQGGFCPKPGKVRATIKHTTDGGRTWKTKYEELISENLCDNGLFSVYFADPKTGWAIGDNGLILHTTDGGNHWARQKSDYKKETYLRKMQFVDLKTGWIIGTAVPENYLGIIFHTEDGGHSWKTQYKYKNKWLDGIFFTDHKSGWVSGQEEYGPRRLLHTTDGGKTWSEKDFSSSGDNSNLAFLDKKRGVLTSEKAWIYFTIDGGVAWTKMRMPLNKYPWHFSEIFEKTKFNKTTGHFDKLSFMR